MVTLYRYRICDTECSRIPVFVSRIRRPVLRIERQDGRRSLLSPKEDTPLKGRMKNTRVKPILRVLAH
jgi:hypothetical protein